MSWLYAQTWLWYLIAFVIGVLLAWAFLVVPQQRRLRAPESGATGRDVDAGGRRDAAADDRGRMTPASRAQAAGLAAAGAGSRAPPAPRCSTPNRPPTRPARRHRRPRRPGDRAAARRRPGAEQPGHHRAAGPAAVGRHIDRRDPDRARGRAGDSGGRRPGGRARRGRRRRIRQRGREPRIRRSRGHPRSSDMDLRRPRSAGVGRRRGPRATRVPPVRWSRRCSGGGRRRERVGVGQQHPPATDSASPEAVTTDSATTDAAATDSAAGSAEPGPTPPPEPATGTAEPAGPDPDPNPPTPSRRNGRRACSAPRPPRPVPRSPRAPTRDRPAPAADGAAPSPEFTIKGNEDSMLFHTPDSPYYGRTRAEVWFTTAEDAEAAGFTSWTRKN